MKVLVTGGTGVIGEGLIPALLRAGHSIRLLTRGAEDDARRWPRRVEPRVADVSSPKSLRGAAEGCGAVVHVTGIVKESPPKVTFERVNVAGTRNVLREAERAGARRFVFVSSLGADRGESDYHRSKLRAEEVVQSSPLDWLIVRPGAVYGPGDEVVSTLLKMMRALPAVPTVGAGDQRFQPVWHEDLGEAIALAVKDKKLSRRTLEVAGGEITTTRDIIERMGRITGITPTVVPVPEFLATLGVRAAEALSLDRLITDALNLDVPLDEAKLTMLVEENFIREPTPNALTEVFRLTPTPLDEGLRKLADSIPEQLPSEGFGPLRRKVFWADIRNSRYRAPDLLALFRDRVTDIMPLEFSAEPGAPREIRKDATLTARLPARGHIQMKVAESDDARVTFVTVEGHPLAGVVQFRTEERRGRVRFAVEVHARSSNALDFVAMSTVGSFLQDRNWEEVVRRVVERSGGSAPDGVRHESKTLDEAEAEAVERWVEGLVETRKREQTDAGGEPPTRAAKSRATKSGAKAAGRGARKASAKAGAGRAASKAGHGGAAKKTAAGARPTSSDSRDAGAALASAVGSLASATLDAVRNVTKAAERATRPTPKRAATKRAAAKRGARKRR